MNPEITIVRVRRNGVPAGPESAWLRGIKEELGDKAEVLEMPFPADCSASDFAGDFLAAMAGARGEWVHVASDCVKPDAGVLARALDELARQGGRELQGIAFAGRTVLPDGRTSSLFTGGFSAEAAETGKAEHPDLADPAWLLGFFVLKTAAARTVAEDLYRLVDPVPAVLAFAVASRLSAFAAEGLLLQGMQPAVTAMPVPTADSLLSRALADFEAGREQEAVQGLEDFRFGWGRAVVPDLYRCVLTAKRGKIWEAAHMTRMFLRRNPGNPQAEKLMETLGPRTANVRMAFSSVERSLHSAGGIADAAGERWLFETVQSLHDQAAILHVASSALRDTLAMAYACMGSARSIRVLCPFHAAGAGGRGADILKGALGRHDLDDIVSVPPGMREGMKELEAGPRPDFILVDWTEDPEGLSAAFSAALARAKEGAWVVARGVVPTRFEAWKAWLGAEPGLRDRGRQGALAWGRKAARPALPEVTFPELWKRMRRDFPHERTMISPDRFRNAFSLARIVDIKGIPGAIVECGVWKGGCSSSMVLAVQQSGKGRHLWAFDSFQGLPKPTEKDGSYAFQKSAEWGGGGCEATEEDFRETLFGIAGLKDENVHIRKGWFQDTLPAAKAEIGPISILRLDGDWYESVLVCLEHLYDSVVPGGYVLIDDYGYWEGARKATDEFRARRGIRSPLITTDHDERYWMKVEEGPGWVPGSAAPAEASAAAGLTKGGEHVG